MEKNILPCWAPTQLSPIFLFISVLIFYAMPGMAPPMEIFCPPDITIDCSMDVSDLNVTGHPTTMGGCDNGSTITFSDEYLLFECSHQLILRTFTAISCDETASCNQLINVLDLFHITITCPPDITVANCTSSTQPNSSGTGAPLVVDNCTETSF